MTILVRLKAAAKAARLAYKYADSYEIDDAFIGKTISGAPLTQRERKRLIERVVAAFRPSSHYLRGSQIPTFMANCAECESLKIDSGYEVKRRCELCDERY